MEYENRNGDGMSATQTEARGRTAGVADVPVLDEEVVAEEVAPGGRKRKLIFLVVGVLALTLIGFAARGWWFGRSHVTSDNAQVEGHITPVLARVGAYVADVRVADNQQVKAGDTLAVLDDRDLRTRLAQAEGELGALEATLGVGTSVGQVEAQISAARSTAAAATATVAQARANADRLQADLARYERLAADNIISRQQLDAVRANAMAATAQLQAAQQNAQAAQDQIASATAAAQSASSRVAAARAARDEAALQLSYTHILAPADGLVSKKSVEVGQLVSPGQPLMAIVPLRDVWVVANLKETEIEDIQRGDSVDFTVDAYPDRTFHGLVESLSPATGAKFSLLPPDNATGNFTKVVQRIPVKIQVAGGEDTAHPLRPGMSAEVVIATR
jgi:membrane fusion protein (multidrug efflux system)